MEYKCSDCKQVKSFKDDADAERNGWIIFRQGPIVKDLLYCQSCKKM